MLKVSLIAVALVCLAILVHVSLPRVWKPDTTYGVALTAGNLPTQKVQQLDALYGNAASLDRAMIVLKDGQVVYQQGPVDKIMHAHSNRKAMISLLFGIAEKQNLVKLNSSLAEHTQVVDRVEYFTPK